MLFRGSHDANAILGVSNIYRTSPVHPDVLVLHVRVGGMRSKILVQSNFSPRFRGSPYAKPTQGVSSIYRALLEYPTVLLLPVSG